MNFKYVVEYQGAKVAVKYNAKTEEVQVAGLFKNLGLVLLVMVEAFNFEELGDVDCRTPNGKRSFHFQLSVVGWTEALDRMKNLDFIVTPTKSFRRILW